VAGEYRLTIRATPRPPEAVEFYGTKLEVRFRCELEARLERRSDKTFELIREFSFVEDVSGRKDQDLSDRAYRKALASLVERLRASGALAGSRKPAERSLDSQEWNRISEPGQRS
jgi:hypothetical protein